MKNEINPAHDGRLDTEIERVMQELEAASPNAFARRIMLQISDLEADPILWGATIISGNLEVYNSGFFSNPDLLIKAVVDQNDPKILREKAKKLLEKAESIENKDL